MDQPIELEMAISHLIAQIPRQRKTRQVQLLDALDCYLAEDLYAPIHVPTFNRSAMDGYAVKSAWTKGVTKKKPLQLKVVGEVVAGVSEKKLAHENCAMHIMTGAQIPEGYDAVVRLEDTNNGQQDVQIYTEVKAYTNYGVKGEDMKKGEFVLSRKTKLTPVHLGVIASLGIVQIKVLQPLKVGLISTGNELAKCGEPLKEGQIYNSNQMILAGRLKELKVELVYTAQLDDDVTAISEQIKKQLAEVDVIITTGGVSVGKKDMMPVVIKKLNAKRLFWKINIQPGTPVLASTYEGKLILSLSGNPFAALTTFELLFRPVLSAFMTVNDEGLIRKKARLMNDFSKASKRRRFVRAYYKEGQVFLTTEKHASSVLSSMLICNCFIDFTAGSTPVEKGSWVNVVLISQSY